MTNKILILLACLIGICLAEEGIKHPWYMEFRGNNVFSNFQIEEQIDIPDEFGQLDTTKQDFLMRLSIENLKALYYSRGYFSLEMNLDIRREHISQDSVQRGYIIFINEGERYRFGGTKVIAPDTNAIEIKTTSLETSKDNYYSQDDISKDMQTIMDVYRQEGFLHTQVSSVEMLDTVNKKIYVEISVRPGAKVIMGNIRSTTARVQDRGNRGEKSEEGLSDTAWLSSLWRIPKGETIDGKQYNSFKNKLFSTQLFTQIRLEDSLRTDGLSDVHLNVTERVPGDARYGFFFEEIYGFGAQAYARHKNFFGRFNEFSTNFQIAQHKQEISAGYANPLLFGTSFTMIPTAIRFEDRLTFNHEKINPPAYPDSIEERYEVINRGDLTFGITQHIRFRGTFDTRYVDKNDERLFKLKTEVALTFDYTDDYFNPTKGIRFAPTTGVGTNLKGGLDSPHMIGNPYTYAEATTNLYFPLFWTFYGALSGSCGRFFNEAIEDDARVFYQGGSRSVRGYRFRSIYASYTSTETDKNGKEKEVINTGLTPQYLRLNQEIRWTIPVRSWRKWQIVQFFDWAKVTDADDGLYEEEEDASFGFGLRYRWQFLTFRLDYAFKKQFQDMSLSEPFAWGRFAFDLSHTF
ncbi:BamA/TamA family outer membrane protein [uncultured Fibrobacter sp.]|uniref:BamA/TamA family outer membrane protein n=1 Tax=uncultured Fibrobacter sp. TaxID=261512 RepID=UPI0025E8C41C|nr:BamA/TamA family outer membrane protein [uncultured Fibrobacter sp.]